MPREWQQKRYKQFVLPDAVYFQCVWAVRDLYRMEKRIEELERKKKASEREGFGGERAGEEGFAAERARWPLQRLYGSATRGSTMETDLTPARRNGPS